MKTSRAQMKKAMETYINGMTEEELTKSLEDAGLSYYKNFKVSIFSHLPDYEEQAPVTIEETEREKRNTLFGKVYGFSRVTQPPLRFDTPVKDGSRTSCSLDDGRKGIPEWFRTQDSNDRIAA